MLMMRSRCHAWAADSWMTKVLGLSHIQNCMWMLQGMLSDGRPSLEAVAPAASMHVKAAAVAVMGNRLTAALGPSGGLSTLLDDAHLLPWRAFHLMAYMVRAHTSHRWRTSLCTCVTYTVYSSRPQQRMACVRL